MKQKYSIAVCEDEAPVCRMICRLCGEILEKKQIPYSITPYFSGEELDAALEVDGEKFNLLILDILLDGISGLDLAKKLRARKNWVGIVFLTGHERYWQEGYWLKAANYLLKPLKKEELETVLLEEWELHLRPRDLVLKWKDRVLRFPLESIQYLETGGNHRVQIVLADRVENLHLTLTEAEKSLPPGQFVRCHNSYLINLAHVKRMDGSSIHMDNGKKIPVGRVYYKNCSDAYINWLNQ